MGRLIDADELIKYIKIWEIGMSISSDQKEFINCVNEQFTAFDLDKVVEQLKQLKTRYFLTIANTGDKKLDVAYENVGNALDKAIELVKEGGVE
jgi:hypothetical protein|nr:MAG TPA_asm: hypothetical protein [Caudoviricetes sp.]DAU16663.1 MAG TPA: hypothetical protein [Caudoviricetes sp.]DAZ80510.1 MAG TPA: hypothetical protein [Caudoviricetes sp.]